MYFVKYGKEYLHDPRVDGCMLLDLSLDCEENSCGYCDFTIYPTNPMYDKIRERDADNPIEVYDDDVLLFAGFIYELGKEFYLDGKVKCKGEMDYLNESVIRPYSTDSRGYGTQCPDTAYEYFKWLIEQHNSQVKENKQFVVGINQAGINHPSNTVMLANTAYPKTINEIKTNLLDVFGGYLVVRHENGVRHIDYISERKDVNAQILDFGVNLTAYTHTDDSENIATFVVPLGAKMSETYYAFDSGYTETADTALDSTKTYYTRAEIVYDACTGLTEFKSDVTYYELAANVYSATSDTAPDASKTYYVLEPYKYSQCNDDLAAFEEGVTYYEYDAAQDESDLPLTVEGISNWADNNDGYKLSGDMVYNDEAVKKYGWIAGEYSNSEYAFREPLIDAAIIALKELVSPKRTIEIKAVDMHLINHDIKPIRIGEYVRVRSGPHNVDSYFLCVSISLDLNNPENSTYTLGTTFDTLTGQQNKQINALNATINQQYEKATKTLSIAQNAAANAQKTANAAVASISEEFAVSATPNEAPTEGWSTATPDYTSDVFVWRRVVSTYGDGTTSTGTAACVNSVPGSAGADGEDAVLLRIDSSRGTVFKNNSISTVLSAVIYKGSERITDITALRSAFGSGAYLEWSWQKIDENTFGTISSSDSMIGNDGFSLTISAAEVDSKVTFMCQLKV